MLNFEVIVAELMKFNFNCFWFETLEIKRGIDWAHDRLETMFGDKLSIFLSFSSFQMIF